MMFAFKYLPKGTLVYHLCHLGIGWMLAI